MIVIFKKDAPAARIRELCTRFEQQGLRIHSDGEGTRVEFIVPVRRQADV